MGPIDYSLNIANPLQSVLQGYQLGQQIQQQRLAQQQAEQQRIAAQQKAQVMGGLMRPDVTFSDYMKAAQMFPDEAKGLLEQWKTLDEMGRATQFNAVAAAYPLIKQNDDGTFDATAAIAKLEEYAAGAENSGNKPLADKLREQAAFVKANPAAGRATIGFGLAVLDKDRAKAVLETELGPIDTTTVKNLIAEGLRPGTPEFQAALREERTKVTFTTPDGRFFSGPSAEAAKYFGEAIPPDAQRGDLPRPKSKQEFDALPPGAAFIAPDGSVRTKPGGNRTPASTGTVVLKRDQAVLKKSMGEPAYRQWLVKFGLTEEK